MSSYYYYYELKLIIIHDFNLPHTDDNESMGDADGSVVCTVYMYMYFYYVTTKNISGNLMTSKIECRPVSSEKSLEI